MTLVACGVDHGVDGLLNVVKSEGIRTLILTYALKDPLKPCSN
jgi:hypothetical protein